MYTVRTSCGAPAFSTDNSSTVLVGYLYYDNNGVDLTGTPVSGKDSNSTEKKTSPPFNNMPRRNETFNNETGYFPEKRALKGVYNVQVGGIKAFGNPVQGTSAMAMKLNKTQDTCNFNRTMMIAVTALETQISTFKVNLQSVNFSSTELWEVPVEEEPETPDDSFAQSLSGVVSIMIISIFGMFY